MSQNVAANHPAYQLRLDDDHQPIWRCPCGSDNPLNLPGGVWLRFCPVCQREPAPTRKAVALALGHAW
jgi:hypothetical protein